MGGGALAASRGSSQLLLVPVHAEIGFFQRARRCNCKTDSKPAQSGISRSVLGLHEGLDGQKLEIPF